MKSIMIFQGSVEGRKACMAGSGVRSEVWPGMRGVLLFGKCIGTISSGVFC